MVLDSARDPLERVHVGPGAAQAAEALALAVDEHGVLVLGRRAPHAGHAPDLGQQLGRHALGLAGDGVLPAEVPLIHGLADGRVQGRREDGDAGDQGDADGYRRRRRGRPARVAHGVGPGEAAGGATRGGQQPDEHDRRGGREHDRGDDEDEARAGACEQHLGGTAVRADPQEEQAGGDGEQPEADPEPDPALGLLHGGALVQGGDRRRPARPPGRDPGGEQGDAHPEHEAPCHRGRRHGRADRQVEADHAEQLAETDGDEQAEDESDHGADEADDRGLAEQRPAHLLAPAPTARSSAISRARCATTIENVLKMRKPPTSSATTANPSST